MTARIASDPGYQICVRCIMDTSDGQVFFDGDGVCNYCRDFDRHVKPSWPPGESQRRRLERKLEEMRAAGRGREHDCIIGLSGGLDSTYLAYCARDFGLRPLIVHVDTGWNTDLASRNIETTLRKLGYDFHTVVIDWEEMRDLQVAFLRSGVANLDIPQDHAIITALYRTAREYGIRYMLSGQNHASESVLPRTWGYDNADGYHVLSIWRKFSRHKPRRFPLMTFSELCGYRWSHPQDDRLESIAPLNFLPYRREEAIALLQDRLGFRKYEGKHGESRFTPYFQGHLLLRKHGYDKRRAHLASLVLSGQISRAEALGALEAPPLTDAEAKALERFVLKKLELEDAEFARIMAAPARNFMDYPSYHDRIRRMEWLLQTEAPRAVIDREIDDADALMEEAMYGETLASFTPVDAGRPIYLYGTGAGGRSMLEQLRSRGYGNVRGFIDSRQGGSLEGLPVMTLDAYIPTHQDTHQILVCSQYHAQITRLLVRGGITAFYRAHLLMQG